ncbi:hypothetical protein F441_06969 [Phytophthora nicotianae CJ01A1]|nr:hypothetical protein L915_06837 [Phytophthora nicotianae]ETL42403.1 hypothetical protein L916_06779 [Phytophthora nicotianae]ETP18875.1 hypothetical protein F441_06969 [Phytophthora nicotianae CJ01A1]
MRVHYLVMVMMVAVLTNSPASASSSGSASFGSSMSGDDIPTTITAGSMSEYEPISFNRDLAVEQNENNDKASLRIHSDVDESSGEDEERYSNKLSWNQFAKMLRLVF